MAEDRYLPLNLDTVRECELFMLPGIGSTLDAFRIGPLRVSRLSFADWSLIEKGQFSDDLHDVYVYGREPLFCIFGGGDPAPADDVRNARSQARATLVKRLILALRLCRPEIVADATMFIVYRRSNGTNSRDPRVFGRNGYSRQATLVLGEAEIQRLNLVMDAIEVFEDFRSSAPVSFAIELFHNSYAEAAMEARDRQLLLLGALEALTDGKRQPVDSIPFEDEALKRFLKTFRRMRNEIAHGGEGAEEGDVVALREIIRCLICEGIAVELLSPGAERSWGMPLLEGMRTQTKFGAERLAEVRANYQRGFG